MTVDLVRVRELVAAVQSSRVTELTVKGPQGAVTVRRAVVASTPAVSVAAANGKPIAAVAIESLDPPQPSSLTVRSLGVGFVKLQLGTAANTRIEEGDLVNDQQLLCIIASMNVATEIFAPCAGRIARIEVKPDQPVEYGQPLLVIEPT